MIWKNDRFQLIIIHGAFNANEYQKVKMEYFKNEKNNDLILYQDGGSYYKLSISNVEFLPIENLTHYISILSWIFEPYSKKILKKSNHNT